MNQPEAVAISTAERLWSQDRAEALNYLAALISRESDPVPYLFAYANLLARNRQHSDACKVYSQLLAMQPEHCESRVNYAVQLRLAGELARAKEQMDRALRLDPSSARLWTNRANLCLEMDLLEEAEADHLKAISLNKEDPHVRWNYALFLLTMGRYNEGWKEYEWRHLIRGECPRASHLNERTRLRLDSRRNILIQFEQGLGDAIQMLRYGIMMQSAGMDVSIEIPEPLRALVDHINLRSVRLEDKPAPRALEGQLRIPMMSLPLAFDTELSNIPYAGGYIQVEGHPRRRVKNKPIVGVVWAGNKSHVNDRNRSVTPDLLITPLMSEQWELVSLQAQLTAEESQSLTQKFPGLRYFGGQLPDFLATARLLAEVDLLVTVDTSIAHLAGSMAVPTILMVGWNGDWRWHRDVGPTAWYRSLHIIRRHQGEGISNWLARGRIQLESHLKETLL